MKHYVHHINGEIICREHTNAPSVIPGATRIEMEDHEVVSHETHKVVRGKITHRGNHRGRGARLHELAGQAADGLAHHHRKRAA